MDEQIAMGNRASVSASEKEVEEEKAGNCSETAPAPTPPGIKPQDDPDFAEELAELEGIRSDDVPEDEFANEQLEEGPENESLLPIESNGKSKLLMEDVSSEDEGEFINEKPIRISTESLTSVDDVVLPDKSHPEVSNLITPAAPTHDKHTEPLSDTDSLAIEKEASFDHADGIRIHIRSMEDELDDINSDEDDYSAEPEPELAEG